METNINKQKINDTNKPNMTSFKENELWTHIIVDREQIHIC